MTLISKAKKQCGFSLIMAVFILVVLSLLGTAMINILAGGADTVAREVLSTRSLFAAESGAQRLLNQIFVASGTVDVSACDSVPADGNPENHDFTLGGLFGCANVSVDCSYVTVNSINYFLVQSTGSCGPASDPAVRVIEVQAKDG